MPSSCIVSLTLYSIWFLRATIRFGIGNVRLTKRVLSRFMEKLKARRSDIDIHIHVEYNNQQGTLFDIHLTPQDIITSLESSEVGSVLHHNIFCTNPNERSDAWGCYTFNIFFVSILLCYDVLIILFADDGCPSNWRQCSQRGGNPWYCFQFVQISMSSRPLPWEKNLQYDIT